MMKNFIVNDIKYIVILFCIQIIFLPYCFTIDHLRFQKITTDEGLSNDMVLSVIQDAQGFIWIGTADGLNRFDGINFRVYKSDLRLTNTIKGNIVRSLYPAQDNNIWIGTDRALHQYNPVSEKFKVFDQLKTGYLQGQIYSITGDSYSTIWVAVNEAGISAIHFLEDDSIEVFNLTDQKSNEHHLLSDNINMICADQEDNIWVATDKGITKIIPRKGHRQRFSDIKTVHYIHEHGNINSLSFEHISSVYSDRQNNIWCGSLNGINIITPEGNIRNPLNDPSLGFTRDMDIRDVIEHKGVIWISTGNGLMKFLPDKTNEYVFFRNDPFDNFSIGTNDLGALMIDSFENLWVNSYKGMNKFDLNRKKFFTVRKLLKRDNSLMNSNVNGIFEQDSHKVWIGHNSGIDILNKKTGSIEHYKHDAADPGSIPKGSVFSIEMDYNHHMWIGTNMISRLACNHKLHLKCGFEHFVYDPSRKNSLGGWAVFNIYQDPLGPLWINTITGGISRLDNPDAEYRDIVFTNYSHQVNNPNSLNTTQTWCTLRDRSGRFWIGTNNGMDELINTDKGTIFKHYVNDPDDSTTIGPGSVKCIFEPRERNILWIGTEGGGLNKFDKENLVFYRFTEKDGLPNNSVWGILEDDHGLLWMSTNNGIVKFNPVEERFIHYTEKDGLQNDKFNMGAYHKGNSGCFYFGGDKGLNYFFPDSIVDNPHKPQIVLTDLLISNKRVEVGQSFEGQVVLKKSIAFTESLELNHKINDLAFKFVSLHFSSPKNNQIKYMLEGFDDKWMTTTNQDNQAIYTNINPGTYKFRVIGSNNDNIWNIEGKTLDISISPPFWKTWWFIIISVLFSMGIIFLYVFWRIDAIKQKNILLEKKGQRTHL